MNRNERYPRRSCCGAGNLPRGARAACELDPARAEAREDDRCLCTSQPIALAMSYVKKQQLGAVYSPMEALAAGTLFPELNKPYCAGGKRR